MDDKVKQLISGLKSGMAQLEAAMGQNTYTDGKAFGNPVESYDDKDVDLGGEDGDDEKIRKFLSMAKKKMGED